MKRLITLIIVMGLALVSMNWFADENKTIAQQKVSTGFPSGNWTFSAHPFTGKGYERRPAVVTSVASDARTLSVTSLRIQNISSKPIIAVKLEWSLHKENMAKFHHHGNTPLIYLDKELPSASNRVLRAPVISFLEISKPFIRKGELEGSYRLDVSVVQVLFADQSNWTQGEAVAIRSANGETVINAGYAKNSRLVIVAPFVPSPACAHQQCVLDPVPPPSYRCNSSDNDEFCTNCGSTCCNTICGSSPACNCE